MRLCVRGLIYLASAVTVLLCAGCLEEGEEEPDVAVRVSNLGAQDQLGHAALEFMVDGEPVMLDGDDFEVDISYLGADGQWRQASDASVGEAGQAPVDVMLVADNSKSVDGYNAAIQAAARGFADTVYAAHPDARLGLVRVSSRAQLIQRLTPNAHQYDAAIDQLRVDNGWTALWDGVRIGNEALEHDFVVVDWPEEPWPQACLNTAHRTIVVFTDGGDNNSANESSSTTDSGDGIDTRLDDLVDLSVFGSKTPISVVAVGDDIDTERLTRLAGETQGVYTPVDDFDGLAQALLHAAERATNAIPVCFSLEDPEATRVRVDVQIEVDGRQVERSFEFPIPRARCHSDATLESEWHAEHEPMVCPPQDASLSLEEAVALADYGCVEQSTDTPPHADVFEFGEAAYEPPTDAERAGLDAVLPRVFEAVADPTIDLSALRSEVEQAGLALYSVQSGGDAWVLLGEKSGTWRGTGGYLLRRGEVADEAVVQAPHTYFEDSTGPVAQAVLSNSDVRGFYFSTLHRFFLLPGMTCEPGIYPSDVAHVTNSFFHQLSVHYLSAFADATLVQLHGFHNPTLDAQGIGTVVSAGTSEPTEQARRFAQTLGASFGGASVALFPEDTDFYGGTLNIQGRWIYTNMRGHFVHVELSRAVREHILTDANSRTALIAAVEAAAR